MDIKDLDPQSRLGMLDEHGHREFIIPAEVKGFYKSLKAKFHFVLIIFFLAMPWIYVDGKQLLLFNISQRKFHFFGMQLFAHDAPLVFFLLIIFVVGLALATALFGRVWCGWACPQTVFIEALYRQIEIWTEGNYIARRKLRNEPMSFRKFRKSGLKWVLYVIVSSLVAHSFIAYFTGSRELLEMVDGPPSENFSYFMLVTVITGFLLFNFSWFREQFCVIMCPYGKFQSALMDSQTVTVMYDPERGEPRKGQVSQGQTQGDCVSCNRCVQVCPTKIDIRNGIQLECIGCTACIDACDDIMTKVNKPTGLIGYKPATKQKVNWFRPRIILYSSVLFISTIAFGVLLVKSQPIRVEILRAKSFPYSVQTVDSEQVVQNQFKLRMENHFPEKTSVRVSSPANIKLVMPENPTTLEVDQKRDIPLFITVPLKNFKAGRFDAEIDVWDEVHNRVLMKKVITILGPINN